MKLNYDFPLEVRNLFIDCWECYECGQNGQGRGGLQLHHIWGRVSASAFNCAPLCAFPCHDRISGSVEERQKYFMQTYRHLRNMAYAGMFKIEDADEGFIKLVFADIGDLLSTVVLAPKG